MGAHKHIRELQSLTDTTSHRLLCSIYVHHRDIAIKLWLASGYDFIEMPMNMLFHASSIDILSKSNIIRYYAHHHDWLVQCRLFEYMELFAPEIPESRQINSDIELTDDQLRAIKVLRTISHYEDFYEKPTFGVLSLKSITFRNITKAPNHSGLPLYAALATDDLETLRGYATAPQFDFGRKKIEFAASRRAIKCFRFLSLNGCQIDEHTLTSAIEGGCEEIIQLCLEAGLTPNDQSFTFAITKHRNEIVSWLMDVYGFEIGLNEYREALLVSNWRIVVDYYRPFIYNLITTEARQYQPGQRRMSIDSIKIDQETLAEHFTMPGDVSHDMRRFLFTLVSEPNVARSFCNSIEPETIAVLDSPEFSDMLQLEAVSPETIRAAADFRSFRLLAMLRERGQIDTEEKNTNALRLSITETNIMTGKFDFESTRILLEYGADPNCVIVTDKVARAFCGPYRLNHRHITTPFCDAVKSGIVDFVKLFVERDGTKEFHNIPFLNHAVAIASLTVTEYLLSQGFDPNARDYNGVTAVMVAAMAGNLDLLKLFTKSGGDVNLSDNQGRTALMYVAAMGDESLQCMNKVQTRRYLNGYDDYPSDRAFRHALYDDCITYLITQGANPCARDNTGTTVLMYAATAKTIELQSFQYLVDRGCRLSDVDENGRTVLFYASAAETPIQFNLTEHLLEIGLDPNALDSSGDPPLLYAAMRQIGSNVTALLDYSADPNLVRNPR